MKHCLECHRTGDIGPFSLEAHEDVVGGIDTSLDVIDNGRMPPWHADPKHGTFANARQMPEADVSLVMTTVVLVAGFSTVAFSDSRDHHIFATMGAITIGFALVGDLMILPALVSWFGPNE